MRYRQRTARIIPSFFFVFCNSKAMTAAFTTSAPRPSKTASTTELCQFPSGGENNKIKNELQSLYTNDELRKLLDLHGTLSETIPNFAESSTDEINGAADIPDLHNLVLQTLDNLENDVSPVPIDELPIELLRFDSHLELEDFEKILPNIRAIVSDVDGTLLSSTHTLHPNTKSAMKNALEAAFSPTHPLQYFFPATGKTRAGALHSLGPEMEALMQQVPGVFVQGLYCVDSSGKVVFEKKLPSVAAEQAEVLAREFDVSLIGYDGDTLCFSRDSKDKHAEECHSKYGEPVPIRLTGNIIDYQPGFHKVLLMNDDPDFLTNIVRPRLEALAEKLDCVVTQAIPNMLELLPSGCSKAVGLAKLLEVLGLDYSQVCAIGDAENDLDMLRRAAIGVAVGNAAPSVKEIADVALEETNNDGGAGRAIELFGLGKVTKALQAINGK